MSEHEMVLDMVRSVLRDHARPDDADDHAFDVRLWELLDDSGLTRYPYSGASDGFDATLAQQAEVLAEIASAAADAPLLETWTAGWLLERCGERVPDGPIDISFGRPAAAPAPAAFGGRAAALAPHVLSVEGDAGIARLLRRDGEGASVELEVSPGLATEAELRHAVAVSASMEGAMAAAFELTLAYALQRKQFGRPIARFQAVQDLLARAVAEIAAANAANRVAAELEGTETFALAAALARTRAGAAATVVARAAHQVHGAIGITREYRLEALTRRLWLLRDDGASERSWARRSGRLVLEAVDAAPPDVRDGLWYALERVAAPAGADGGG